MTGLNRPEVQRLVAGGKRAALPLVARGQLRVEGDLGQLATDLGMGGLGFCMGRILCHFRVLIQS